ncbi:MAG: hemerythrin domain-containing protein [Polyangiaceae bacterium]
MKATALLESQHKQIAALIEELERPGADRKSLVDRLATSVLAHMVIEEEIFYPQAEKVHRELALHGAEDHESEIPVLERLAATPASDERFAVRLQALKVLIQHHVDEEEGFLFPAVNRAIPSEKNAHLGHQMKARFEQVSKQGHAAALKLRTEEAEKRAPGGITALGGAKTEAGKGTSEKGKKGEAEKESQKGQKESEKETQKGQSQKESHRGQSQKESHKGQSQKESHKGQSQKGEAEKETQKGRSEKGRSERSDSCEEESQDSVDAEESEAGESRSRTSRSSKEEKERSQVEQPEAERSRAKEGEREERRSEKGQSEKSKSEEGQSEERRGEAKADFDASEEAEAPTEPAGTTH